MITEQVNFFLVRFECSCLSRCNWRTYVNDNQQCGVYTQENYSSIRHQTGESLLSNGLNQFRIRKRKTEFKSGLTDSPFAILAIAGLLVAGFLNSVSISEQAIVSILEK